MPERILTGRLALLYYSFKTIYIKINVPEFYEKQDLPILKTSRSRRENIFEKRTKCACPKHCFPIVQVCRWSKVWSTAVVCSDYTLIFSQNAIPMYEFILLKVVKSISIIYQFQPLAICKPFITRRYL